jgi:hypothetical protein
MAQPPLDRSRPREAVWAGLVFVLAFIVCLAVYLAIAVPQSWFPSSSPITWSARDLALVRGSGERIADELVIASPDASGVTLITLAVNLRSTDYAAIAWIGNDFPDQVDARLLWRTDHAPGRLNTKPLHIEAGRPLPVIMTSQPEWVGRITGLALAVQGPLPKPMHIRGVVAKPMGAREVVGDRLHEWLAFEGWTGTSINTISGGDEVQDLPLALLLGYVIALAAAACVLIRRFRPDVLGLSPAVIVGAFFLTGWLLLDARWASNLWRQERVTAKQYAGKDWRARHLAVEDGPLFAFIERSLSVLPAAPVRIFIVSDADYFRGRAAYHLYPHSPFFEPRSNQLQPASRMRPGDWLLVYQRRGIQYDPVRQTLKWNGDQTINAELKLSGPGAALFLIR